MASNRSLGSLTLDLVAKIGGFTTSLDQASANSKKNFKDIESNADAFGDKITDVFTKAAAAIGIGFSVEKFVESIKESINVMDEMSKSAQKVGLSTEAFSSLAFAAKLADVNADSLQSTLGKLTKSQAAALDANSQQAKVFKALGIAVTDSNGKLRSSEDVLKDFADVFQGLHGSPEALAAGFALFGKGFQDIVPLLKDGAQGISDAQEEANKLNVTIGTETGQAAEQFNDNLTRLHGAVDGIFNGIAQRLLPSLVEWTNEMVKTAENGSSLDEIADTLTKTIQGLVLVLDAAGLSFKGAKGFVSAFTAEMLGAVDQAQAVGKLLAGNIGWGQFVKQFNTAGNAANDTALDAMKNTKEGMQKTVSEMKDIVTGASKSIAPKSNDNGAIWDKMFDTYGAEQKAKGAQDRLSKVFGKQDEKNKASAKAADILSDAYAKLFDAVQKTDESADPTQKAYNTYAATIRSIDALGADAIKKGGDVIRVQNSVAEAVSSAQQKLADDLAAPMKAATAYNDALQEQLKAYQGVIDSKVASIGMGSKEAADQQALAKIYQDSTKAISDFQKQHELHPTAMTDEQYNSELKSLQDYWASYKQMTIDGQAAIDAANADWMNGVTSAWKDFNAQQNDNAKIANQLTTDFLNGSSDALADFLSGNKTAVQSLKDFFTDFEAEVTKAVSKKLMQSFFDSVLGTSNTGASGSGAGGSSYLDFISSLFSSGDSSFFPSFAVGGNIGANTFARVNENGPEMLSVGGQDFLMMGSQGGKITPNSRLSSGSGTSQTNNFYLAAPTNTRTQTQIANKTNYEMRRASRLG